MKSIFPSAIDGDLHKLVHLSNSFRMVQIEGAKPLQVGDICRPDARIVSMTNSSEGKIVYGVCPSHGRQQLRICGALSVRSARCRKNYRPLP